MFYFLFMLINSLLYGKFGGSGKSFSLGSSPPPKNRTTNTTTAVAPRLYNTINWNFSLSQKFWLSEFGLWFQKFFFLQLFL